MFIRKEKELKLINGRTVHYNEFLINLLKKKIESFLEDKEYLNTEQFAAEMMFPSEIGFNNLLEEVDDDFDEILKKVEEKDELSYSQKGRIINLINGYHYIFQGNDINKDSLRKLYDILSIGLLSDFSEEHMGDYYRKDRVYILKNGSFASLDFEEGYPPEKLEKFMDNYFEYINSEDRISQIDEFIKSQVMHFYLCAIHPYFDVNGRTSRTAAMWHLLNKEAYPYILFNRAIYFSRENYPKAIRVGKKTGEVTAFIEFMLRHVYKELKKMDIIKKLQEQESLSQNETHILYYYFSFHYEPTIDELIYFFNNKDPHRSTTKVLVDKIYPLIEKGILIEGKNDKGKDILRFNYDMIEDKKVKTYNLNTRKPF